jgi:A/G-specific adenine glycosylase
MEGGDVRRFRAALLRWYRKNRRAMPWRAEPGTRGDPYAVLVSEAMLQQTQVATVVDYFKRFMAALPTVAALAAADEQRVLHLWQGLGYYRRARHLHRAARVIVENHGGELPRTAAALLELPGVGRYTAGAVASIAFGEESPVVDGNVIRVLSRLHRIKKNVEDRRIKERLWELAEQLVRGSDPGDFNQAMMELGATVCLPRGPRCLLCPVSKFCKAYAVGDPEAYPVTAKKAAPRSVVHRAMVIRRTDGRLLLRKRGDGGLWAGMWELPTLEDETVEAAAWVFAEFGLRIGEPRKRGEFQHVTTHRRIRLEVWEAAVIGGRLRRGAGQWREAGDAADLPLSAAQKKAMAIAVSLPKGAGKY